mmetsp:Transcript_101907/g.287572  ORF Transcript_101907/g.287572 Transcript_101907/m.287572 type:complete len:336 (+) Transcript_101907:571-1578(+)
MLEDGHANPAAVLRVDELPDMLRNPGWDFRHVAAVHAVPVTLQDPHQELAADGHGRSTPQQRVQEGHALRHSNFVPLDLAVHDRLQDGIRESNVVAARTVWAFARPDGVQKPRLQREDCMTVVDGPHEKSAILGEALHELPLFPGLRSGEGGLRHARSILVRNDLVEVRAQPVGQVFALRGVPGAKEVHKHLRPHPATGHHLGIHLLAVLVDESSPHVGRHAAEDLGEHLALTLHVSLLGLCARGVLHAGRGLPLEQTPLLDGQPEHAVFERLDLTRGFSPPGLRPLVLALRAHLALGRVSLRTLARSSPGARPLPEGQVDCMGRVHDDRVRCPH